MEHDINEQINLLMSRYTELNKIFWEENNLCCGLTTRNFILYMNSTIVIMLCHRTC